MRLSTALLPIFFAAPIFFACAASSDEARGLDTPDARDASGEQSPRSEAGSDAGDSDARVPATPKPLDVVCEGAPCYIAISGNDSLHYCGLLEDKTVRCWGRDTKTVGEDGDSDGALGRGAPVSPVEGATPAPVVGLPGPVDRVRVGPNLGTCARTLDGRVYCWGRNDRGQLGAPPEQPRLVTPTRVEGLPPVDDVALGVARSCAITTGERSLYCWGTDMNGVFEPPHPMLGFHPPVRALAIGTLKGKEEWGEESQDTIVTLLDAAVLAATGFALPSGDSDYPRDPLLRSRIARIGPFAFVGKDGSVRRWIPNEETLYFLPSAPIVELAISGELFADRSRDAQRGGALTATGRLFRWGTNLNGELGMEPRKLAASSYPVEVLQVRNKVAAFATTIASSCALLVTGKIQCWGANSSGELGRGSIDFDPHPEPELIR